jgi:Helix-turn-helix.
MTVEQQYLTVPEWEARVGKQIRAARITANLDRATLAKRADLSVGAIQSLEGGTGSSLKTLIRVLRALDRTDWLEALAPPITVSPLRMLAADRSSPTERQRVSSRRSARSR